MEKDQIRIVVNRVNEKLYSTVKITVDDVMDRAGLPLLGIVPEDPAVTLAAAFEKPLLRYTKKGAAAACKRMAKRIEPGNVGQVDLLNMKSGWSRDD